MPLPALVLAGWGAAKGWAARTAAARGIQGIVAATRTQKAIEIKTAASLAAAQTLGMNSTNPQRTKRYIENGIDLIENTSSHLSFGVSRGEFLQNSASDLRKSKRPIETNSGPNGGSSTSTARNYRRTGRTRYGKRSNKGTTVQQNGKDKGRPNSITLGTKSSNPTYNPGGGFMPE